MIVDPNALYTGTIKTLKEGYGFLKVPALGKDVFFHAKSLEGVQFSDLEVENTLEFKVEEGQKGLNALNVTLVA